MRHVMAALLVLACAGAAEAQTARVVLRGRGQPESDARIREILRDPDVQIWTRDTLIARGDTVRGPVLVTGATARIEGTLLDELYIIAGDVFVRPSARLHGAVTNLGGGWYPSALATLPASVDSDPNAPYEVIQDEGVTVIRGTTHRRVVGFQPIIPTYDRVDGVSLGARALLLSPALGRLEPSLAAWGVYRSQRGSLDGGAEARVARGGTSLAAGAERTTLTNQEWIKGDLTNSIAYLFRGKDYRDYYEAERAWVELRRVAGRGPSGIELYVRGQVEEATSLRAGSPWSLFKPDSIRPNGYPDPEFNDPVRRSADQGRITSIIAGSSVAWQRPTFVTELDISTEFGVDMLDSDFTFNRFEITGEFAMLALRDHTLEIEAHARGPISESRCADCTERTVTIPRQRWSSVGGSGTLYTFDTAQFFGDRVVFVETSYHIPLGRRFRLGMLGIPDLELIHAAGMAWTESTKRSLKQNVGIRLNYNVVNLRVVTNPENFTGDVEFSLGVDFPSPGFPWQQ